MTEEAKPKRKSQSRYNREYNRLQRLKNQFDDLFARTKSFHYDCDKWGEERNKLFLSPDYQRSLQTTRAYFEGYVDYWWAMLYRHELKFIHTIDGKDLNHDQVKQFFIDNPQRSYSELTNGRHCWDGDPRYPW